MNSVERRSIEKIIRGRFELLATELDELAAEYRQAAIAEIENDFAKELREAEKANAVLAAEAEKMNAQINKIVNQLKGKGIEPAGRYGWQVNKFIEIVDHIEWHPTGLAKARELAIGQVNKRLNTAKNNLRREELTLLENLHRTTIESGEASDFLTELPTAEDLLAKAAEPRALSAG